MGSEFFLENVKLQVRKRGNKGNMLTRVTIVREFIEVLDELCENIENLPGPSIWCSWSRLKPCSFLHCSFYNHADSNRSRCDCAAKKSEQKGGHTKGTPLCCQNVDHTIAGWRLLDCEKHCEGNLNH